MSCWHYVEHCTCGATLARCGHADKPTVIIISPDACPTCRSKRFARELGEGVPIEEADKAKLINGYIGTIG